MEARSHAFTYGGYTDQLMRQFEEPSDTMANIIAQGVSQGEAITRLTSIVADGFCDATNPGQAALFMAEWYNALKAQCSERYQLLLEEDPKQSREAINQEEVLIRLNAIRRGVKIARQHNYSLARVVRLGLQQRSQ